MFRSTCTLVGLVLACATPSVALVAQERQPAAPEAPVRRPITERVAAPLPLGTFFASRIDREELPVTDRVVDEDGTIYLIEFDRLVIALKEDFTFRASVRYRRTLFASDPRGRVRPTPLQTMTVTGRWDIAAASIRFFPDPSADSRNLRMLAGTVTSLRELSVPFHYRNGTEARERTLVLRRRDNVL